jgi:hypothetical protein
MLCFIDEIREIDHPQYHDSWQIIGTVSWDGLLSLAAFLNASAVSRCAFWIFCK